MRPTRFLAALVVAASVATMVADENHEIIEKVMEEGLKGDDSPMAQVLAGKASAEDTAALAKLVKTLAGTKAPKGEQAAYEKKVAELIAAMDAVAGGDRGEAAIGRLKTAQNCKACHTDHRPKK